MNSVDVNLGRRLCRVAGMNNGRFLQLFLKRSIKFIVTFIHSVYIGLQAVSLIVTYLIQLMWVLVQSGKNQTEKRRKYLKKVFITVSKTHFHCLNLFLRRSHL